MHQLVTLFHAALQCQNSCVCINANYTYSEQLPIAQQRQIFATHFSLNHLEGEIVQSKLHLKVHLNQTLFGVLLSGDEAGRAAAVGATIPFLDLTFPIVILVNFSCHTRWCSALLIHTLVAALLLLREK